MGRPDQAGRGHHGRPRQALQLGAAQEVLELWRVHTEHINRVRVFENSGKGRGC
jgi:hypothetical protein